MCVAEPICFVGSLQVITTLLIIIHLAPHSHTHLRKRWWIWTVQIPTIKSISCNVFLSPTRYVHIRVCMYFCMAVKASLGGRWYSLKMTGPCHRPSTMHQGGSQGIALHQRRRDALAVPTALAKATLGIATFFHTRDSSQPPIIHPTPLCAPVTDTDN